jgi:AraC family transcriptional regulator of adaptative response/methylated-DNA-[protein]-cysteine methyltransferase
VCALSLGDDAQTLLVQLQAEFAHAQLRAELAQPGQPARLAVWLEQVTAYVAGRQAQLHLPLDVLASPFQRLVWQQLLQVPYGATRTYTEIAQALGAPNKVRAVASACARNPVALLIPCHRIVQKSGALAGYRWGLARKAALLERETTGRAEAAAPP